MNPTNQSKMTYFIIKGISDVPKLQAPIFLLVLFIYLLTLGGNLTIVLLICLDPQLHTPMYFFLTNLSIMDISSTTATLHTVFISFTTGDNTISFIRCMTQFYIFTSLTCDELFLLTVMSFDRYVAICKPLHYHMVMDVRVCALLAMVCWLWVLIGIIPHVVILSGNSCYTSMEINHFFCDITPLLKLMCSHVHLLRVLMSTCATFLAIFPPILTFTPYVFIILTVVKIKSSSGRRKAFYTCSSHLTVVTLLYVTLICQYMRPTAVDSLDSTKLFSLFNTVAVPVLNPVIYSLKNKEVNASLRRRLKMCKDFLCQFLL